MKCLEIAYEKTNFTSLCLPDDCLLKGNWSIFKPKQTEYRTKFFPDKLRNEADF
ncbi:hypothetical protein HMPREF1042_1904 [Streptococcus constellatus subsp. pharyngis SK1060 = CCUG 46377]|uniref:Uncharacterized protein n=1 Tax=Streptococcus constellatus subsp. pharyngis SK1060 = CCUG 46377 TaxID=1035184 RepID=F9P7P1_STRCV|nr:hypothetical protein HMPREF1042_1904 [Streptococcus constellatus subsp. pharyngis SK1060 = CCUG 46377]